MRVAINGWFWDQLTTGSGQMVRQLLPALLQADDVLEIVLVLPRWAADQVTAPSPFCTASATPAENEGNSALMRMSYGENGCYCGHVGYQRG